MAQHNIDTDCREFDTLEDAWEVVYALTDDDPCCDNSRFAWFDDKDAMEKYDKQRDEGCCGFIDLEVMIAGRKAWIGLNYGH